MPANLGATGSSPTHTYKLRDYMAPAGDIAMPLPDFARLVQLHLRGLLGKRNYLSAATYQTIHFGKPEYAYGWGVEKLDTTGALVSFHNGTAGTFYCHAILVPSQKVTFVVLTNQGGDAAENACNELRIRLNKLYLQGKL
jgi:D-alanyl-D-alanine carboxypeptidase